MIPTGRSSRAWTKDRRSFLAATKQLAASSRMGKRSKREQWWEKLGKVRRRQSDEMLKITSKLQPPTSREDPNTKLQSVPAAYRFLRWILDFESWIFSGSWRLDVG